MKNLNVLVIFFNNVERLSEVFGVLKKVKPEKLFLYQDGPRKGRTDEEGIDECREYINSNIDWECEIHKLYQKTNVGVDPSEYIAQKWAFSFVEKCVVLEDDDVPNETFFEYCVELLDKYENDKRINIICGMNNLDVYGNPKDDYFFAPGGSIWGWASWRRVLDTWDENYSWLDDQEKIKKIKRHYKKVGINYKDVIKRAEEKRKLGIAFYEMILGISCILNDRVNIIPTHNLMRNIGFGGGVHSSADNLEMVPRQITDLYNQKTHSLSFPIKHPSVFFADYRYVKKIYKKNKINIFVRAFYWLKRKIK